MNLLLQLAIIPLLFFIAMGLCVLIKRKFGEHLKIFRFKKLLTYIASIVFVLICILIFNRSFFVEQPISDIILTILAIPVISFFAGAVVYTVTKIVIESILKSILETNTHDYSDKIREKSFLMAWTVASVTFIGIIIYTNLS